MRKSIIFLSLLLLSCTAYVIIINRNSATTTMRQKILKAFYPLLTGITKLTGKNSKAHLADIRVEPPVQF